MFMVPMKLVLVVLIGLYLHITSKPLSAQTPGVLLLPLPAATAAAHARWTLGTSSTGYSAGTTTEHLPACGLPKPLCTARGWLCRAPS